jgi:putative solute:sodium symporter small subunit
MTDNRYWLTTRRLTIVLIFIWTVVTFVLTWFAPELNGFSVFGFPFAFYMAAQGNLLIYLALIWFYNRRMRKVEDECGVADE